MPWVPLLDGDRAEDALIAVRDIALDLAAAHESTASASDRMLFWAYAAPVIDEPFAHQAYETTLDSLISDLRGGAVPSPGLYGGLAGYGWVISHVLESWADDALDTIDEVLVAWLSGERGHYDLLHGFTGLGIYFLERIGHGDAPAARDGLARVISRLAERAIETPDGTTWSNSPAQWPNGFYDCGVAHGVAGVIGLLARAAEVSDAPARARALCTGATRWLAAQRSEPGAHGRFPRHVEDGARPQRTRAAWCYGDPGIAAALWRASPALARGTALEATERDAATCGVQDACLCHGAAGLAHLNNRLFQASGEPRLGEAARAWFARALDLRRPDGIGGFAMSTTAEDATPIWLPVASFLEGAIGIGLALLAAVTPREPNWDRLLLCDLPPCEGAQ